MTGTNVCAKRSRDPQFRQSERGLRIAQRLQKTVCCTRCWNTLEKKGETDMRLLGRAAKCRICFDALLEDIILHECLLAVLSVHARASEIAARK